MVDSPFEFELYRLNVIPTEEPLFEAMHPSIEGDDNIMRVLERATDSRFKSRTEGERATYEWVLRAYHIVSEVSDPRGTVATVTLARSLIQQRGFIVTDNDIVEGESEADPPLAATVKMFFYMARHLVAVEHVSAVTGTGRWRSALQEILEFAIIDLEMSGRLELEPMPKEEEIMRAFRSFERLSRLRVLLRLPNPELSRYSRQLYGEMQRGAVAEYLQDMKNPKGLNKDAGKLPFAAAEIAQAGYKKGEVKMEGVRDGEQTTVHIGNRAARGRVGQLRDFVRGIGANARARETQRAVSAILDEIDRVATPPDGAEE